MIGPCGQDERLIRTKRIISHPSFNNKKIAKAKTDGAYFFWSSDADRENSLRLAKGIINWKSKCEQMSESNWKMFWCKLKQVDDFGRLTSFFAHSNCHQPCLPSKWTFEESEIICRSTLIYSNWSLTSALGITMMGRWRIDFLGSRIEVLNINDLGMPIEDDAGNSLIS